MLDRTKLTPEQLELLEKLEAYYANLNAKTF